MIRLVSVKGPFALAFGLAMAAAGVAWGGAPGYYVTELDGIGSAAPTLDNSYGESLLPNGTVIGATDYVTVDYAATWNGSGTRTDLYTGLGPDILNNVFGDSSGRVGIDGDIGYGASRAAGVYLYSGGSLTLVPQLSGISAMLTGMSSNGLMVGYWQPANGTAFAYDAATSTYYTFGSAGSWAQGVNANGYVVGGDGANGDGFVWSESTGSYTQIPGLAAAQAISNNNQLIAGLTQGAGPDAAVYNSSGALVGTYWAGEATGVNNSGVVVGDTAASVYNGGGDSNWQGHAMAYVPGINDPQGFDLNAYAPAGVTFNVAQAVNDAGQILVWSNGWSEDTTACTSYLLTPALPGDANVDGRVDVNDLTVVLTNFGQTGMSWETGDFTGDGKVDVNDLTIVLAHFGQSSGSSAAGPAAVPEPGAIALLAGALVGLLVYAARRRR